MPERLLSKRSRWTKQIHCRVWGWAWHKSEQGKSGRQAAEKLRSLRVLTRITHSCAAIWAKLTSKKNAISWQGTSLPPPRSLIRKIPTPWFYDAIRKQTANRPVEALQDLQKSIELNDNRAVYRSRLLLDEDLAARSASLGRIYSDLGFQQLGSGGRVEIGEYRS